MFCKKCGATIPEASKFCPRCGENLNAAAPAVPPIPQAPRISQQQSSIQSVQIPSTMPVQVETESSQAVQAQPMPQGTNVGVRCPACHSSNLFPITENTSTTTGKSFSGGKGCLGFLLLGPLGLLCGSCGANQTTVNTSKTFWVCKDCGHKFRNVAELMRETQSQAKAFLFLTVFTAVLAVFLFVCALMSPPAMGPLTYSLTGIMGIFAVLCFVGRQKYKKDYENARRQNDENQQNANNKI